MELTNFIILLCIGIIIGAINTISGGGSMLSLPTLMFMGLPPSIANGTNRISVLMGTFFGVMGFKSKGTVFNKHHFLLAGASIAGAIIGAHISINIPDDVFKKLLSIVMLLILANNILNKRPSSSGQGLFSEQLSSSTKCKSLISFFIVGLYGGIIQVGVGIIILSVAGHFFQTPLAKANALKLLVCFIYTIFVLAVFMLNGKVHLACGLSLGVGNAIGSWLMSRWSVNTNDQLISIIVNIVILAMALKLWL